MSAAAGAGASDADIIIRGEKLQSLLGESYVFRDLLSDLTEADIKRIIKEGPKNTDIVVLKHNTFNGLEDDMKRDFILAYLGKKEKLGTLFPSGNILQGYKQSKMPTGNARNYWNYLIVSDPEARIKGLKEIFTEIIPAKPRKTRLAPRASKKSWSNSSSSNSNSSNKNTRKHLNKSHMLIKNYNLAAKYLSGKKLEELIRMNKKIGSKQSYTRKPSTRKGKKEKRKPTHRESRSHSR
jgi:hypothetical protein